MALCTVDHVTFFKRMEKCIRTNRTPCVSEVYSQGAAEKQPLFTDAVFPDSTQKQHKFIYTFRPYSALGKLFQMAVPLVCVNFFQSNQ